MEARSNLCQIGLWCLTISWGVAVISGISLLTLYSATPGGTRTVPAAWPNDVAITVTEGESTFVVFIHPQCPCTVATLSELARLDAEIDSQLRPIFVLVCPESLQSEWANSALARRCQTIPDGRLIVDSDGQLAKRFEATTNGYCLLYCPIGRLLFQGGVTTARGHEGESLGRVALKQLLSGQPNSIDCAPVFGSELSQSNQVAAKLVCCKECLL